MNLNPYASPATEGQAVAPKPTVLRQIGYGAWRGLRSGFVVGICTAICIMTIIGAMFPTHPLEAIGVYNLVFMPLFLGTVSGSVGAIVGSVVAGIVAAVSRSKA